jgi:hypothetical protein
MRFQGNGKEPGALGRSHNQCQLTMPLEEGTLSAQLSTPESQRINLTIHKNMEKHKTLDIVATI